VKPDPHGSDPVTQSAGDITSRGTIARHRIQPGVERTESHRNLLDVEGSFSTFFGYDFASDPLYDEREIAYSTWTLGNRTAYVSNWSGVRPIRAFA
jgi:hypothetical protein